MPLLVAGRVRAPEHMLCRSPNRTEPAKDLKIAQGENQKITINVARGKEFKEKVTLACKTDAKGLTFAKDKIEVDPMAKELAITLTAAKDTLAADQLQWNATIAAQRQQLATDQAKLITDERNGA